MIVYGKRRHRLAVRPAMHELEAAREPGTARLLAAGELACGLLDACAARRGADERGPLEDACHRLVLAAAAGSSLAGPMAELGALELPVEVEVAAMLEGFAHYGLSPDTYTRAARAARAAGGPRPDGVVGLRSIGLVLGAVVAVELGARRFASVRPVGHPFSREVRLGPILSRDLLTPAPAAVAVVDEGPGLSGSSFAAVAAWLDARGVSGERVVFFPGHGGEPGHAASDDVRRRWASASRVVPADEAPPAGMTDVSGGGWRGALGLDPAAWPPSDRRTERRKLLEPSPRSGGVRWMRRFAGLGWPGAVKQARARELARRGLHPPVGDLERGYLAVEWMTGARPLLRVDDAPRAELLATVAEYLAARAALPACPRAGGASPDELLAMARHNAALALGQEAAAPLERLVPAARAAAAVAVPAAIDGRLHRWEWIRLPAGRLLKTDAVDHALGHDLVGEQDLAWDLAGAAVELALDPGEEEALAARVGRRAAPAVAAFYRATYVAFQLGAFTMAVDLVRGAGDADEAARLAAEASRYRDELARLLAAQAA